MAAIDIYGDKATQVINAYKPFRPDGPSDDEVTKWLTGEYGHGDANNLAPVLAAITNSDEAKNYAQKPSAGTGGNPTVGQPNPNVSTTMPVPPRQPNTPYQNLDWWSGQGVGYGQIFNQQTGQINPGWARTGNGYERTQGGAPQGGNYQSWFLSRMGNGPSSPEALAALEPELAKYGIKLQKDSAGTIRGRMYLPDGSAVDVVPNNGWGQPWQWINRGTGGGSHGGGVGQGVGLPGSQYSDPHTKLLEELMLARIGSLQQGNDPGYQQMMAYLQQRFQDLQGPGRTGAENEVIRTQALDPIESDRQAARKRVTERMAAAGHTMDSGVMQMALNEVDKAFDGMRASTQNVMASDELQRREGRNQRAEGLAGSIYGIPQARNREAIGYAGALSDLGPQRMQLAMQAAGMGGSPQGMFQSLMQMAQMNQNSALLNQQNSGQLWGGLGELAYTLMNAGK
jgi:hypothetical protein